MADEDEAGKLLPEATGFRSAEAFQLGFEPNGGVTIHLVAYEGDTPLRFAAISLTPEEADELARVLPVRRQLHDQHRREQQAGAKQ